MCVCVGWCENFFKRAFRRQCGGDSLFSPPLTEKEAAAAAVKDGLLIGRGGRCEGEDLELGRPVRVLLAVWKGMQRSAERGGGGRRE